MTSDVRRQLTTFSVIQSSVQKDTHCTRIDWPCRIGLFMPREHGIQLY